MVDAVVVASSRTPLAKSFRGSFNLTRPDDMLAHCLRHVVCKVPELSLSELEDVIVGCAYPEGAQGSNVARIAALRAQFPHDVAAVTVNRFCASGLQAIVMAARSIAAGGVSAAIGGGVESISGIRSSTAHRNSWLVEHCPAIYMAMGDTAEVVAKRYRVSRAVQDEVALTSQQRTAQAQDAGVFDAELAPMEVARGLLDRQSGEIVARETVLFERDECNRRDTNLDALSGLRPYFDSTSGEGTVTAGNSSQLSDGASATLLMSRDRAKELGIRPLVVFRGFSVAGCAPDEMGIGPVFAIPKLLARHGLKVGDIDLWELNEAFAVQVAYCRDRLGIDPGKMNVHGGSIALGHPFGMTGSRLVGTLAHAMQRRQAARGVVSMCIGGGQGAAALFELC
ncbi:MAG: acetyl-CoA C-acyltransferase [Planctomycetaceae bacterium]|nr:acetyl-CoA C-acyltransferase [Planctomycetaceae bacterium]